MKVRVTTASTTTATSSSWPTFRQTADARLTSTRPDQAGSHRLQCTWSATGWHFTAGSPYSRLVRKLSELICICQSVGKSGGGELFGVTMLGSEGPFYELTSKYVVIFGVWSAANSPGEPSVLVGASPGYVTNLAIPYFLFGDFWNRVPPAFPLLSCSRRDASPILGDDIHHVVIGGLVVID